MSLVTTLQTARPLIRLTCASQSRWTRTPLACLIFAGIALCHGGIAGAQIRIQQGPNGVIQVVPNNPVQESNFNNVTLPSNRSLSRAIQLAIAGIESGEYTQSVALLDDLLGRAEDLFVETGTSGEFLGLKALASQTLATLPEEGKRTYESSFAPIAERKLSEALSAGDVARLDRIALRYFNTPAGRQAAFLLAVFEADAGRHSAACAMYDQLLESGNALREFGVALSVRAAVSWLAAGDANRANEILSAVPVSDNERIQVGNRVLRVSDLVSADSPVDRLASELELDFFPIQNDSSTTTTNYNDTRLGGSPHMWMRWKARLLYPTLEPVFRRLWSDMRQSASATIPSSRPVVSGDYVLVRGADNLTAASLRTGKLLWRVSEPVQPELEQLVRIDSTDSRGDPTRAPSYAFLRRIWQDNLWGRIAVNGDLAYAVGGLDMPGADREYEVRMMMMWRNGLADIAGGTNRLTAYRIKENGEVAWQVDGETAGEELSGAFFLGAPLVIDDLLYCLVEIKGEGEGAVYVVALDRLSGEFRWRQQLANLEVGIRFDRQRRLQSATPVYDSGTLVCPTGAGVVVGVDVRRRTLAWAYQYERTDVVVNYNRGRARTEATHTSAYGDGIAISDGKVLLAPYESNEIHCLDLRTGKPIWRQENERIRALACIWQGNALLLGDNHAMAIRLTDGLPVWPGATVSWPDGGTPTGEGFVEGEAYYLPLSSAEVVAIDLSVGRIIKRTPTRDGEVLGSLVRSGGALIAFDGEGIKRFDQVDALRETSESQLSENPNNVRALRSLGEIAYGEGRLREAVDWLDRAYKVDPQDLDTMEVLAECLLRALDEDFSLFEDRLDLLRELSVSNVERRAALARIEAEGRFATGDLITAAEACIAIYKSVAPGNEVLDIGRDHQVAISRWARGLMNRIWDDSDEAVRNELSVRLLALFEAIGESEDRLQRYIAFFGDLPPVAQAKLRLARRMGETGRLLAGQQLLLDLLKSKDRSIRGAATALLSDALHRAGWHESASEFDAALLRDYAETICLDGKTGPELVEQQLNVAEQAPAHWPVGRVNVKEVTTPSASARAVLNKPLVGLRIEQCDSIMEGAKAFVGTRGDQFAVRNEVGREIFSVLNHSSTNRNIRAYSGFAVASGSLLIASRGAHLTAYNLLAINTGQPSTLWRKNLLNSFDLSQVIRRLDPLVGGIPGSNRAQRSIWDGRWIGVMGPVNANGCVYLDQGELICVDAVTGEQLWARSDVPAECELYGDMETVVAVPRNSRTALLFSMIDGSSLGEGAAPARQEQLTTRGRRAIRWRKTPTGYELSSVDVATGESNWSHAYGPTALVDVDKGRYIAVLDPGSRLVVVDADDGHTLLDHPAEQERTRTELHLSAGSDAFVIVTSRPLREKVRREVSAFSLAADHPIVDGSVYAFDRRSGAMLWSRPADVVGQGFALNQPVDLPVIVFVSQINRQTPNRGSNKMSMLVLDKRTGRTLYRSVNLPRSSNGFCVVGQDADDPSIVNIQMARTTVQLKFTDEPTSPSPPALAEVETHAESRGGGLGAIGRQLLREIEQ